jgi:hypothetical protein
MARQSAHYVLEATPYSVVVCCRHCAWRGLAHTRPSAYRLVAAHLRQVHDETRGASAAFRASVNAHVVRESAL